MRRLSYEDAAKRLVWELKFGAWEEAGVVLGWHMSWAVRARGWEPEPDRLGCPCRKAQA